MPALTLLGRRWNTGSDDFVVFGLTLATIHVIWASVLLVIFHGVDVVHCSAAGHARDFIVMLIVLHAASCVLYLSLGVASGRGRMLQLSKRAAVPVLLYGVILCTVVDLIVTALLTHEVFASTELRSCTSHVQIGVLTATVGVRWALIGIFFLSAICCFDPAGRRVLSTAEDVEQLWESRCRCMFCCVPTGDDEDVFSEASKVVAAVFQGTDIVPSDVAAGLILLRARQKRAHRERSQVYKEHVQRGPSTGKLSSQLRLLKRLSEDQKQHVRQIQYYSRFAFAVFGWPIYYYFNFPHGPCKLACRDPSGCWRARPHIIDTAPSCCKCYLTAMQDIAGIPDHDVIMTNFASRFVCPAFYVALDRQRLTVVISIRGTMSLHDTLTDGIAHCDSLVVRDLEGTAYVHAGILRSARNIETLMLERNVIEMMTTGQFKDYKVEVVGHSLGAGTASVLSVILRSTYPSLKPRLHCIAYSPPGGLFSRNLSEFSSSFITACFVGKDMVPRLSLQSMERFRDAIYHAIASSKRSKATILCSCCCPSDAFLLEPSESTTFALGVDERTKMDEYFDMDKREQFSSAIDQRVGSSSRSNNESSVASPVCVPLFPPSNIVQFVKISGGTCVKESYYPVWVSVDELQEVISSPLMIGDHMPDKCSRVIDSVAAALESGELSRYEMDHDGTAAEGLNSPLYSFPSGFQSSTPHTS